MKQVEVTILGQSYLLACPEDGQEALLQAVATVDREMSAIRDAGKVKARERMAVLAALSSVDWVVDFDDDTPEALIAQLRPDVLVKGGDYRLDEVVGAGLVRAWGGEVRVLSHLENFSTTSIIERLQDGGESA